MTHRNVSRLIVTFEYFPFDDLMFGPPLVHKAGRTMNEENKGKSATECLAGRQSVFPKIRFTAVHKPGAIDWRTDTCTGTIGSLLGY